MNIEEENDKKLYILEDKADAFKEHGEILLEVKAIKPTKKGPSKDIKIFIMANHVLYTHPRYNEFIKTIKLGFDIRYDIEIDEQNLKMRKLNFFKNEGKKIFILDDVSSNQIHEILKKRINQVKFHETFKASKKLGRGSFAHVYMVEKNGTKECSAVKAFNKKCSYSQNKGKEAIINEIAIMKMLDHENCLKLYEVFETENSLYLVMEYMQGMPLSNYLKKQGKLHENEALKLLKQILQGVEHMNKKNIMHRDLKPDNIIFKDEKNTILGIVDFGLAMKMGDPFLFYRCGTPGYVAPEVANFKDGCEPYDIQCDIFSAGVILHQMLLAIPVFKAANYNELLQLNRKCEIDYSKETYKWISGRMVEVLQLILEKDPMKRINPTDLLNSEVFVKKAADNPLKIDLENVMEEETESHLEHQMRTHEIGTPLAKLKEKLQQNVEPDSCFSMVMRQPLFNSTPKSIDNLNSRNNFASKDVSPEVSPRSRPKMSNFGKNTPKKDNFEGGFGQAMSLFSRKSEPGKEDEEEKK